MNTKIKERLVYELTREPKERKESMQNIAFKLLIGFFAAMVLLTIVSRAANSIIVARISVDSVKEGELNFKLVGNGVLEEKSEQYLDLYKGVRINKIFVEEGQNVEKGDVLLQYNINDLEGILDDLDDELTKAELNLEKGKLSSQVTKTMTTTQVAELILQRAQIDLEIVNEDLETAKENVNKKIREKYTEVEIDYNEAKEVYSELEEEKKEKIEKATKEVKETEEALNELCEKKTKVAMVIDNYRLVIENKNINLVSAAETSIYTEYYGEEYTNHLKAVEKAKRTLTRANEDYWNAQMMATEEGKELSATDKATYNRAIQDANEVLIDLTAKDTELMKVIINFRIAIQNNNQNDIANTYTILFSFLYEEDNNTKKQINTAKRTIATAQEVLEETKKDWDKKLKKEENKVANAGKVLKKEEIIYNQILDNTYDYSKDVIMEERLLKSAKRTVEDANVSLKQARESDIDVAQKYNTNKRIGDIDLEINEIDLRNKQEAVVEAKKIIENKGKVTSRVNGVVIKLGAVIGNVITGQEKVSIALNNYGFIAKVAKDDIKRFSVGDEMSIYIGNSKEKITVVIENIGLENTKGKVEISGIMPKGDYSVDTIVSFEVSNKSQKYSKTIPIQALRMDGNKKYYVLVAEEKNTILGNQLIAVRMDVNVLDKDYVTAAIEGSLYSEDKVIVSSNKNIEEGDRVRASEIND